MMGGRRCVEMNSLGQLCGGFAISGSDRCFAHDPGSAVNRDTARRRGGRAGRVMSLPESSIPVRSLNDVIALIEETINDVRAGRVDARVANSVGYLANVAIKGIEQSALERRLDSFESVLEPERQRSISLRRGSKGDD
jgi:hypothetical protein